MMKKFVVLLDQPIDRVGIEILERIADVRVASGYSREILERECKDADPDACVTRGFGVYDKRIMDIAPRLKVIGMHGVGLDLVDVNEATKRGIAVVYTPEANMNSVADHAMGLLLAVAKKIMLGDRLLKTGASWETRHEIAGVEVWNKTLGIVGFGRIGSQVAKRAKGFDMKVLVYDPYISRDRVEEVGAGLTDFSTVLQKSDFVTVHVPLTKETEKLIGRKELGMMKDGAILVNTARGAVIDEKAMYKALLDGKLAGAGLDVFEFEGREPYDPTNPIFKLKNVVCTPHVAALTNEAISRMAKTVAEEVTKVLEGKMPKYIANPSVYECSGRDL